MEENSRSTVYVEGEGRLIGRLTVPKVLWDKMQVAPVIVLHTSLQQRIQIAMEDYVVMLFQQIEKDPGVSGDRSRAFEIFASRHRLSLEKIQKRLGGKKYLRARGLLDDALLAHQQHDDIAPYEEFIRLILCEYYDPMYDYQLGQRQSTIVFQGNQEEVLDWISHHEGGAK